VGIFINTMRLQSDINRDEPALFGKGESADNYETGKSRKQQDSYMKQLLGLP
jgi:hypothetical protein